MNMLTSLKALLFSSTASGKSPEGAGAASLPTLHAADFAELFSGSIADAALAQGTPADVAQLALPAEAMPQFKAAAVDAESGDRAIWRHSGEFFPPGLAPSANRTATLPSLHLPDAEPAEFALAATPHGRAEAQDLPKIHPLTMEFNIAETPIDAEPTDKADKPAAKDELIEDLTAPAPPAPPVPMTIVMEPVPTPRAPQVEVVQIEAAASGVVLAAPALHQPQPMVEKTAEPNSIRMPVRASAPASAGGDIPAEPPADMLAKPQIADISIPLTTLRKDAVARFSTPIDTASAPEGPARSDVPISNGKPIKSEALALLQLVREQAAAGRFDAPHRSAEQVSTAASAGHDGKSNAVDTPTTPLSVPASDGVAPLPASSQPATSSLAVAPAPSAPIVDLPASLGAQVVDMGVSGQWIDGLARDIAGLSANGAQGRFQINTDQLGLVRVDIRQGTDGAAVHLTVATEAAELALRQDSDRLKLDASLSAVRIAEMKIDRAPVAEAARTETAGQQSSQQQSQHSSAHPQPNWANGSQDMSQPQGQQGRWQTRQNNGFDPKSSEDPAVLNHGPARQAADEAARARYA